MKKTLLVSYAIYISMLFANVSTINASAKAAEAGGRVDSFLTSVSPPPTETVQLTSLDDRLASLSQKVRTLKKDTSEVYSPRSASTASFQEDSDSAPLPYTGATYLTAQKSADFLSHTETNIRILVLDGGGIRGLLELEFLAYLEQRSGKHTTEMFHLMGGTSAGGQIVTLLSIKDPKTNKPKYTAKELLDILLEKFPNTFETKGTTLFGLLGEKYKTTPIKKMLHELAGDAKFHESIIPTVATAYDLSKESKKRLKIFSSMDKEDISALDAMLATSAAPGYFKSHKVNGKEYADGGLISNNPTIIALNEAQRVFPQATRYIVVSLGTGFFQDVVPDLTSLKHVSLLSLARHIPTLFLEGQKDAIEESLEYRPDVIRFRFNPAIKGKKIDLDDASEKNMGRLRAAAFDMIGYEQEKINLLMSLLPTGQNA